MTGVVTLTRGGICGQILTMIACMVAWIMVLLARSIPVTEDTVNGPGKVLAHTAEM